MMIVYKLSEIATNCNSDIVVCNDCDFNITYLVGKNKIENTKVITYLNSIKYLTEFLEAQCDGVICSDEIKNELKKSGYKGGIATSKNPKYSFFVIHNYLGEINCEYEESKIDSTANIHKTAIIDGQGVQIGANCTIGANAIIKQGTRIGNNCTIRENVVIGSPAFYYYGEGEQKKLVKNTGGILIKNNVEIHTSCTVEKGVMYGNTVIGDNTKIDNLVLIGHDSKIGQNCTIAAGCTLAGGVVLNNDIFVGVGASFIPSVEVGSMAKISAGAVVTRNIPSNAHASGNFAIEHEKYIEHIKNISKDHK